MWLVSFNALICDRGGSIRSCVNPVLDFGPIEPALRTGYRRAKVEAPEVLGVTIR